ncbi:MAG: hypothetical protein ACD_62C00182G0006 [uncultured bacterium]|nr:MAG: hypothetical protein ACD_62C00182G0006 [uncultured bacterium]
MIHRVKTAMSKDITKIDLFDYLDYRKYLRDWSSSTKQNNRYFSYRNFAKKAGFGSPNFLQRVINGQQKKLTLQSSITLASAIGLNKQETEFFKNLVAYNQATAHDERDHWYKKLVRSQKYARIKPMMRAEYFYFSKWYNPVIRELIMSPGFDGTPEWLAKSIVPNITPDMAHRSLKQLEELGFIKKVENDRWVQLNPLISTGAEAVDISITNYHQGVLDVIKNQMTEIPANRRQITTFTLGVSKDKLEQIKRRIGDFGNEILKMVADETSSEEVVLVTIHMLPVTDNNKNKI